jgi:hypothetical protein
MSHFDKIINDFKENGVLSHKPLTCQQAEIISSLFESAELPNDKSYWIDVAKDFEIDGGSLGVD